MADYNYILNLFSLLLILGILFIIMYGCQYQQHRKIEKFMDVEEYDRELENQKLLEESQKKIAELTDKLKTDNVSIAKFTNMIEEGEFSKDDLNKMIDYVENFENKLK
jgi:uncharacterized protein HemX